LAIELVKDNDLNVISKFLRKHLKGFAPVENCEQMFKEQTGKLENKG
jgi:hypothetical protein